MNANAKLFLAIPSVVAFCPRDHDGKNHLRDMYAEDFRRLIQSLKDKGILTFCSLEECNWDQKTFHTPLEAVSMDWSNMKDCTDVIACPSFESKPSGGVHIEIGWATALGIRLTIIAAKTELSHSALIKGLSAMEGIDCKIFYFRDRPGEVFSYVIERILSPLEDCTRKHPRY